MENFDLYQNVDVTKMAVLKIMLKPSTGKRKPNQRRPKVTTILQPVRQGWGQEFHCLGTSPTLSDAVRGDLC